ncbi:MAG: XdhC family protein, partial [Luteolibacter sp.]
MPMDIWEQITALRREGLDSVVITIAAVRGSVPGRVGAKALVASAGLVSGNLGGGKVEAKALAFAAEMLTRADPCASVTWNLQRDVGMTCGGEMSFFFERIAALDPWHIAIFGAGHVSQALVPVLATLACRIDVFDTRADWLVKLPALPNVTPRQVASFEDGVEHLAADSFLLSVTRGHASDRPVLREAFRRFPELVFVGVI